MKKANQFILLLFFIIIISIPAYWLLRGKPSEQISIVEGRVLGLPEKSYPTLNIALNFIKQGELKKAFTLVWDLYTMGSLQKKFDGAATDQFPFRMILIKFVKSIDRQIIHLSYHFLKDRVIPADMTSEIYIMLDLNALILPPGTLNDESYENIDKRLENYEDILSKYPNLNIFIYYLETLSYSTYHPLNQYFAKADEGKAFAYFQANLIDDIQLAMMPLEGLSDHIKYYFRTDHHWNTNGILQAYDGIYDLLASKYNNIPEKLTPTALIEFPGVEFHGSLARKTLYPIKGDSLVGFTADFPDCITTDQGIEGDFDSRDEYLNGDIPTTPYLDHYGAYFGSQNGLLEYNCNTKTNRNILIIGDSFTRPLVSLVATLYKQTYFIDLRQSPEFTLTGFLSDHQIQDILIASDSQVVFMDPDLWLIKP